MQAPIAILDCNSFYASCERAFNYEELKNKPIIVLSNNDGVIISLTNEAKALGIDNLTPKFQVEDIIRKHNVKCFSADFNAYNKKSREIMDIVRQYSPFVEVYSIDEAFIKFDGFTRYNITEYAKDIVLTIQNETKVPVTIGISNTKTLAKVANRIAKKQKFDGSVLNLLDYPSNTPFLEQTPIEDIWGIGRRFSMRLRKIGISNALQFSKLEEKWVKKNMSVVGLRTLKELQGFPYLKLNAKKPKKKMIAFTRSFGTKINRYDDIKEAVAFFVSQAAERMRMQKTMAGSLGIFIHTGRHSEKRYFNSYAVHLSNPTEFTPELIHHAIESLKKIYKPGFEYAKAGAILYDLVDSCNNQLQIFDNDNIDRDRLTLATQAMDKINLKMGTGAIFYATVGTEKAWRQNKEFLSRNRKAIIDEILDTESTISFFN